EAESGYISDKDIEERKAKAKQSGDYDEYVKLHDLQKSQVGITELCKYRRVKIDKLLESEGDSIGRITSELVGLGISPYKYRSNSEEHDSAVWHANFIKEEESVRFSERLPSHELMKI
ncbi:hypothetical protein Q6284_31210, partial [Klebsiella pneumoniae]